MGTTKPLPMAADEKKTVLKLFKNKKENFLSLFKKDKRDKDREKEIESQREVLEKIKQIPKVPQVDTLIANFKKLELENARKNLKAERSFEEDELKNFTYKIVQDDQTERNDSQSSQDSGYFEKKLYKDEEECLDDVIERKEHAQDNGDDTNKETDEKCVFTKSDNRKQFENEHKQAKATESKKAQNKDPKINREETAETKNKAETEETKTDEAPDDVTSANEETDDVTKCFEGLNIDEGKRQKKLQTVPLSRGPIRNRAGELNTAHPYDSDSYRQIHQINKQTFSGGQVIVNTNLLHEVSNESYQDGLNELSAALKNVQQNVASVQEDWIVQELVKSVTTTSPMTQDDWDILQELIDEEAVKTPEESMRDFNNQTNLLEGFHIDQNYENVQINNNNNVQQSKSSEQKTLEDFNDNQLNYFDPLELTELIDQDIGRNEGYGNIYPTPPRSENVPSPMSDKSYYPPSAEYISSPALSSPNSEYEKYQEIQPIDDSYPISLDNLDKEDFNQTADRKERERNSSTSSMTMKQFKDLQKEIASTFSNKECCQVARKSCKEIFQERFNKINIEERKSLLQKVASLDLKTAYGVLHHVLLALSAATAPREDVQCSLFALLSEQILAKGPKLFLDQFGLNLIKTAVLRCHTRPELTRYLVKCVRTAMKLDGETNGKEFVFTEIDERGDTLVTQCARAGDACAPALAELLRRDDGDAPLFNLAHADAEGYSALHVACKEHSASSPRLHTVHVLLEHAGMDLWRGDVKGGDTALHLAVNSPWCDLRLVLLIFRPLDRKQWKKLAHAPNRSSCTPLEYARSAAKTATRQNYPQEVLDFLKKCR